MKLRIYDIVFGFLLSGLVFLQFGCKQAPVRPVGILSADTLKMVLMDAHIAEAKMNVHPSSNIDAAGDYYREIFQVYHIDTARFKLSLEYYMRMPDTMDRLYQEMLEEMSMRESKLTVINDSTIKPIERPRIDSSILRRFNIFRKNK